MFNLSEYKKKPNKFSDYLPWAALVADGIVLNKDGSFQKTISYRGPDLESSTHAELVSKTARLNNVLRRLGHGWCLYFEADRQPETGYPDSYFPELGSWLVDEERKNYFSEAGRYYETTYYITLMYLPPSERMSRTEQFLFETTDYERKDNYKAHLKTFIERTGHIFDLLASLFPEVKELSSGETLTYLHGTISSKRHPVNVPPIPAYLDTVLVDTPLIGGFYPRLGDQHVRTITIRGFPGETIPGLLDELNDLNFPYRWVTRWVPLDKEIAESTLRKIRKQWFAKRKSVSALIREAVTEEESPFVDSDAENKALDADEALQELGSDDVIFGYMTITVTLMHEDLATLEEMCASIERIINSRGFTTINETLNAVEAFLGSLPGNPYANVREGIVHSINLAHLMPMSAVWAGPKQNAHLKGPPLFLARMKGSTPFRFSPHIGDVGHSLVVGPTGAGKSVFLSFMALQFRRYNSSQIFFFDKGRSARAAILGMDGISYDLSLTGNHAFQPLAHIDEAEERSFCLSWVMQLLENEDVKADPNMKQEIWDALCNLSSAPKIQRTITGLLALIQNDVVSKALAPYSLNGAYGAVLDSNQDQLYMRNVVHFEMEDILNYPKLALPVLSYLFRKVEKRFDGRPTLLVLDEAWIFLDNPVFAARIREWLKTLRKKNVAVIFATQSLDDIAKSSIAPAIIDSCPTRVFLPNERALEPQIYNIYEMFGLNHRQIEIVSEAIPKREYYTQTARGNRLFELGLGDIALALCGSSSPADQQLMDEIVKKGSQHFLSHFFRAKNMEWAAEIIDRNIEQKATA